MTRDILLNNICPVHRIYDCCNTDADHCFDDCKRIINKWLDEYDKHVIEQYKADTNLKDIIREIHDNVAKEMYCKGIDDFATKICEILENYQTGFNMVSMANIWLISRELAEELKAGGKNE